MKNNYYLIFDFDGTLVDSFYVLMKKFNELADEFKYRKLNSNEINWLRDLTSRELIKYLKIPIYKIPMVLCSVRKYIRSEMQSLLPFQNILEILHQLHDMKIQMGILTSNSIENVTEWLERNKIYHLFNFIHTESSYFGKKHVLQKILKTYDLDNAQTFYIGDETRDIDAARECNVYSAAVTWGFNSEKVLSLHNPDYLIRRPEDILGICKTI